MPPTERWRGGYWRGVTALSNASKKPRRARVGRGGGAHCRRAGVESELVRREKC